MLIVCLVVAQTLPFQSACKQNCFVSVPQACVQACFIWIPTKIECTHICIWLISFRGKNIDVQTRISGTQSWYSAVDKEFRSADIFHGFSEITWVINGVVHIFQYGLVETVFIFWYYTTICSYVTSLHWYWGDLLYAMNEMVLVTFILLTNTCLVHLGIALISLACFKVNFWCAYGLIYPFYDIF